VVVPTKEIEAAWIKDSKKVFGDIKLGTIRGKHIDTDKGITIGSIQTLMKLDPKEWADRFGMVIIDETHRIGAEVFSNVIKRCRSGIRVGLTATDYRKDGRFVSVKWHLGEACYKSEVRTNTVPLTYCTVKTPYGLLKALDNYTFNDLLASLQRNTDRTLTIVLLCEYIIRNYDGDILLVSPRTEHLESIAAALADRHVSVCVITGKTPDRAKLYEDVLNGKYKITVATTSIMSEGASNPRWHHVISTMPFSDMKTAIQLTGRAIRKANGKSKGFFWDIVDANPMAKHMYKSRWNALKKIVKEVLIFNSNATSTTQETRS
jgi:superfamily II DNA or RNA helicase